ncbi:MAG TPA: hypothetical protein VIF60_09730 [Burkholderiaceae bacterium]|jgi:hypothetical protein
MEKLQKMRNQTEILASNFSKLATRNYFTGTFISHHFANRLDRILLPARNHLDSGAKQFPFDRESDMALHTLVKP